MNLCFPFLFLYQLITQHTHIIHNHFTLTFPSTIDKIRSISSFIHCDSRIFSDSFSSSNVSTNSSSKKGNTNLLVLRFFLLYPVFLDHELNFLWLLTRIQQLIHYGGDLRIRLSVRDLVRKEPVRDVLESPLVVSPLVHNRLLQMELNT